MLRTSWSIIVEPSAPDHDLSALVWTAKSARAWCGAAKSPMFRPAGVTAGVDPLNARRQAFHRPQRWLSASSYEPARLQAGCSPLARTVTASQEACIPWYPLPIFQPAALQTRPACPGPSPPARLQKHEPACGAHSQRPTHAPSRGAQAEHHRQSSQLAVSAGCAACGVRKPRHHLDSDCPAASVILPCPALQGRASPR